MMRIAKPNPLATGAIHMPRYIPTITVLLAFLAAGCEPRVVTSQPTASGGGSSAPAKSSVRRIAIIPKGSTHDFWKSIHAGAEKAAKEIGGIQILFKGPEKEDDREQQVILTQHYLGGSVEGVVLAPLDENALLPPVRQLAKAGIPVVIIDSALTGKVGKDFVSFVATDNIAGGRLAGQRMAEVLGGKGRVLMLRHAEGSASTLQREQGFGEALAAHKGIELVDPKRYSGPTRATAQEASENLLTAHADIQGVFCSNESATFGMLLALRGRNLAGKIHFVGFDASPGLVEALGKGELDGLVAQNPVRMGYLGVKTLIDHLDGKPVEPRVDTGVMMVTRENMNTPAAAELLNPDLKSMLGS